MYTCTHNFRQLFVFLFYIATVFLLFLLFLFCICCLLYLT